MNSFEIDASGFDRAIAALQSRVDVRLREGLDLTCEEIAARARQTTTYQDRTGLLRASTQNAGVSGTRDELVGVVSFAARSKNQALYGAYLEHGTRHIRARRFIQDSINAQDGDHLEAALAAAFADAGFEVSGGG